jgi:glutathione S-transferase
MLPLMLKLYTSRLGEAGGAAGAAHRQRAGQPPRLRRPCAAGPRLAGRRRLSGADVQMSFVGEAARGLRASYPAMDAWVRRFQQRPAYQRALERGGPYSMAG